MLVGRLSDGTEHPTARSGCRRHCDRDGGQKTSTAPSRSQGVDLLCSKYAVGAEMINDRIVAVGLLTRHDVEILGPTFERLWPVESIPHFDELLAAIDEADRNRRGFNVEGVARSAPSAEG